MDSCLKCTIGPSGSGGHEDLFSYSFWGASIGMKCRTCERMWLRQSYDAKHFSWTATALSEGALLPQG